VEGWPWPWRAWRALAGKRRRQARPVRARERSRAEQHGALWQREEKWSTEEASCDRRRGVRERRRGQFGHGEHAREGESYTWLDNLFTKFESSNLV